MPSFLAGALLGLALIVALGAQNAFVLRQGLLREHVGLVVAVCAASDVLLIVAGVGGLGRLLDAAPWFADVARWAGAAFLLGYGLLTARRVLAPSSAGLDVDRCHAAVGGSVLATRTRAPVLATALALTWLNPHVYLDTVVLLGSVAATHGDDRWWFALGACTGSVVWFTALGQGARLLGPWLRGPRAWRLLDGAVAATMIGLAVVLAAG